MIASLDLADWLKSKGLHRLRSVIEGIQEPFILSAFHLSGKIGFPGRKSNGTGLSTENFSKKREYLQRYSSFLVFTGITGKSLYHLLYNTSAVLLGKIHDFARENGVLLHVSVSNMRLSF